MFGPLLLRRVSQHGGVILDTTGPRARIKIDVVLPIRDSTDVEELRKLPMHELLTTVYQNGCDMRRTIAEYIPKEESGNGN